MECHLDPNPSDPSGPGQALSVAHTGLARAGTLFFCSIFLSLIGFDCVCIAAASASEGFTPHCERRSHDVPSHGFLVGFLKSLVFGTTALVSTGHRGQRSAIQRARRAPQIGSQSVFSRSGNARDHGGEVTSRTCTLNLGGFFLASGRTLVLARCAGWLAQCELCRKRCAN